LEQQAGERVDPPSMGSDKFPALIDAPGTYVLEK
jgi:poly(3-hydroxyalkanoate) synthetase